MAEIKSTLDIIMEKARGLTITKEEKEEFQKREMEKKVRGLLQKFLDNFLDLERLKAEILSLGEDGQPMARDILLKECLDHLAPAADNGPVFDVLEQVAGIDVTPYQEILSAFEGELERKKALCEKETRQRIAKRGISGSAVVANIHADPQWHRYLSELEHELHGRLSRVRD